MVSVRRMVSDIRNIVMEWRSYRIWIASCARNCPTWQRRILEADRFVPYRDNFYANLLGKLDIGRLPKIGSSLRLFASQT